MRPFHIVFTTILATLLSCSNSQNSSPVPVTIKKEKGSHKLYRGGDPYFIKGAVGWSFFDELEMAGANSLRSSARILDEAHSRGLTMLVNIRMKAERDGFDYNDEEAVRDQFEMARQTVEKYKDHPALLMWAIGNELDHIPGDKDYNLRVWDAINDVAKMIHEVDGNHPALTVVGYGNLEKIKEIKERCPDLDLLGVNAYANIVNVPEWLSKYGWEKPFVVTEWGPSGWWEVPRTKWNVVIEETSSEKARVYRERYEKVILGDPRCIGSYVFLWTTNRQERTHTWFNMFHDSLKTQTVEVMQYMWTGKWPENRAPRIEGITINGKSALDNIRLKPGSTNNARVTTNDPENDRLKISWELLPEPVKFGAYAGQGEKKPIPVENFITGLEDFEIDFRVPEQEDLSYRLFVYVRDGHGNIGVANIPFFAGSD
ncbi:MAG: hypothetical protein K9J30_05560 [Bacteroidales bacterium]|nr:hypothetical protein [Bacteroidales bacterium]